jgi:peptide deformylase
MDTRLDFEIMVPEEFRSLWEENADRPIVKYPAEVLRRPAEPVARVSKSTRELVEHMKRVMRLANGIGLAAPQVGVSERVIVVSDGKRIVPMINPVLTSTSGNATAEEGCLSLPGLYADVRRSSGVEVEALDTEGRKFKQRLEGLAARCVQHEIDHLDGVLFIDRADLATLHWAWPANSGPSK